MVKRFTAVFIAILVALAAAALLYFGASVGSEDQAAQVVPAEMPVPYDDRYRMYVGEEELFVSLAANEAQRRQGLSNTQPLRDREGKFFVFPQSDRYGFWMKDMNYAIDIIWFDAQGYVVHIEREVSPDSYPESFYPEVPARYVLEIAAGYSDYYGIALGQRMSLSETLLRCLRNGCFNE